MTKIVLDAEAFRALASDTRLQILKALDARPLTVSEMSRLLSLNKATVFEHLKQLLAADLTKRDEDPARKWVYYRLTWKGRNVLHPENAQIFLMLGLASLGVGGAIFQTFAILRTAFEPRSVESASSGLGPSSPSPSGEPRRDVASAPGSSGSASPTSSAPSGQSSNPVENAKVDDGAPPGAEASQDGHWYDAFQGTDFFIFLGLVTLLLLAALIIWTIYGDQRRERIAIQALIERLPADVNRAEERLA